MHFEGVRRRLKQLQVFPQLHGLVTEKFVEERVVDVFDDDAVVGPGVPAGSEQVQPAAVDIVDTAEALAHADGP